jgi:hypothetical protein
MSKDRKRRVSQLLEKVRTIGLSGFV